MEHKRQHQLLGEQPDEHPQAQPYIDAVTAWSNDEDGSTNSKDPDAIVKVYGTYKEGAGTSVHARCRTICPVTFRLGNYANVHTPEVRQAGHGVDRVPGRADRGLHHDIADDGRAEDARLRPPPG